MSDRLTIRENTVKAGALEAAKSGGWLRLTRPVVARAAGVSHGTVSNVFETMDAMRDWVMSEAVRLSLVDIVAEGLATRHPVAISAPPDLKALALNRLAS